MRKILATMLVLSMFSMLLPGIQAGESVSAPYNGALGYRHPVSDAPRSYYAVVVCPASCDFNGEYCVEGNCVPVSGLPVINPVGGSRLRVSGTYTNVIITANDDFYGSNAGIATCFWNPDGDNTCSASGDAPDYPSSPGCGPAALLGSPFAANYVTVWIFTVMVEDDLNVCGGTMGTMNGDFF